MSEMEAHIARILRDHETMRPVFDARPTKGVRTRVPRDGAPDVDVYVNEPAHGTPKPWTILNLHGGAYVGGDAVLMDSFCQFLADELGARVVNVNYKKAPEHPFPYAIAETVACARHFRAGGKLALIGHSAGAGVIMGACVAMLRAGERADAQILVYPPVGDGAEAGEDAWCIRMYCPNREDEHDERATPPLAPKGSLRGLAPATFVLCEKDELRAGGEAYAKRLIDEGVPVNARLFEGAVHGFLEVNRPDYFFDDDRKTPEQAALAREAERYVAWALRGAFAR